MGHTVLFRIGHANNARKVLSLQEFGGGSSWRFRISKLNQPPLASAVFCERRSPVPVTERGERGARPSKGKTAGSLWRIDCARAWGTEQEDSAATPRIHTLGGRGPEPDVISCCLHRRSR